MYLKGIVNWFLPPSCPGCNNETLQEHQLCAECWKSITFINTPYCKLCGSPQSFQITDDDFCDSCNYERPLYECARSAAVYDEGSKRLILRLKYVDDTNLVPIFAKWLLKAGQDLFDGADYVIPVPLHWTRLLQRRYNQSALLIMGMRRLSADVPKYAPQFLRRIRRTESQGQKNKEQRFKNVESCFQSPLIYKRELQNKTIIVVDDVMASGATLNECIKTLLDAGCKNVRVLTLARAPLNPI